jgi:hypothetical protein
VRITYWRRREVCPSTRVSRLRLFGGREAKHRREPHRKGDERREIALSEFWSAARSGRLCDSTSIGNVGSVLRRLTKLQPLWHTKPASRDAAWRA